MGFGRNININRANELLAVLATGAYAFGRYMVKIPEYENAKYYNYTELGGLSCVDYSPKHIDDMNISLVNKSTVDVVISEGMHSDSKIGVLNFASAMNPGGGFIKGAMAQEEALCQASTLYPQLKSSKMYTDNRSVQISGYYNHSMNVSDTYFIRDSEYRYIEKPIKATVITSAAVNINRLDTIDKQVIKEVMHQRMEEIIKMFVRYECKTLILGAFGCGVFGNNPYDIAEIWMELLEKYGAHFEKVIFAVKSRKKDMNIVAFIDTFASNGGK